MFAELRELLRSGAIRRHQLGAKDILTPMIHGLLRICKSINHIYYALSFRQIFTIIYIKPTEKQWMAFLLAGTSVIRSSQKIRISNHQQKNML